MNMMANLLVVVVAALHVGFMVLEMFLWTGPIGQRVFALTPELAATMAPLAANQGLYNGFIAAGLLWGASSNRFDLKVFFLVCVVMAGVFGGISAKATILFTQALPGLLALGVVLLANKTR
jgi:putative membrane protein